jgi:hypothetical protein
MHAPHRRRAMEHEEAELDDVDEDELPRGPAAVCPGAPRAGPSSGPAAAVHAPHRRRAMEHEEAERHGA